MKKSCLLPIDDSLIYWAREIGLGMKTIYIGEGTGGKGPLLNKMAPGRVLTAFKKGL